MSNAKQYDAFISYSREDQESAALIHNQLLKRYPLSIFFDQTVPIDGAFADAIAKSIKASEVFLFLVRSKPRKFHKAELQVAVNLSIETGRPVVLPILLPEYEDGAFFGNDEMMFAGTQNIRAFHNDVHESHVLDDLIRFIKNESKVYVSARWSTAR
jgi:hypothetical protein